MYFFFVNDTATTEIYTLSLHDALPISILDGMGEGKDATFVVNRATARDYGLNWDDYKDKSLKERTLTRGQVETNVSQGYDDMSKGVDGVITAFKDLNDVLEPAIGLFEALGNKDRKSVV